MENKAEMVEDIITFFEKFGASNELSNRNLDTGEFMSVEYCNFVVDIGKKYGLYDEDEEAKDVNYVINLEDDIADFFREKLMLAFDTKEWQFSKRYGINYLSVPNLLINLTNVFGFAFLP